MRGVLGVLPLSVIIPCFHTRTRVIKIDLETRDIYILERLENTFPRRFELESHISRACDDNRERIDEYRDRKRSTNSDRESRPLRNSASISKNIIFRAASLRPVSPDFHDPRAATIRNLHKLQKEERGRRGRQEKLGYRISIGRGGGRGRLLIAFHARPRNAIFPSSVNPVAD